MRQSLCFKQQGGNLETLRNGSTSNIMSPVEKQPTLKDIGIEKQMNKKCKIKGCLIEHMPYNIYCGIHYIKHLKRLTQNINRRKARRKQ